MKAVRVRQPRGAVCVVVVVVVVSNTLHQGKNPCVALKKIINTMKIQWGAAAKRARDADEDFNHVLDAVYYTLEDFKENQRAFFEKMEQKVGNDAVALYFESEAGMAALEAERDRRVAAMMVGAREAAEEALAREMEQRREALCRELDAHAERIKRTVEECAARQLLDRRLK